MKETISAKRLKRYAEQRQKASDLDEIDGLLLGCTVSCSGSDITIACHNHDDKDRLMDLLTNERQSAAK